MKSSSKRSLRLKSSSSVNSLPSHDKTRRKLWFASRQVKSSNTAATTSSLTEELDSFDPLGYSASTLCELGLHEANMKRYDEAIDCFLQAIDYQQHETDDPLIFFHLLRLYLIKQDMEMAEQVFPKLKPYLSKMTEFPVSSDQLLDYFVEKKCWNAALIMGEELKSSQMAKIYFHHGRYYNRKESFVKCLKSNPTREEQSSCLQFLFKHYLREQNHALAIRLLKSRRLLLEDPRDIAKSLYEEAEIQVSLKEYTKAQQCLDRGLQVLPRSLNLREAKANLFILMDRQEEALEILASALQHQKTVPQKCKALYTMGCLARTLGMVDEACEYNKHELELTMEYYGEMHLECSRIHHELARIQEEKYDFPAALESLSRALKIEQTALLQRTGEDRTKIMLLVQETKKWMGKLYYKSGDFTAAMSTIADQQIM